MKKSTFCFFLILLLMPLQANAHKIHVFAWVSGNTVTVESASSSNHPLVKGAVTVKNSKTDEILLQGMGDSKGIFTFELPASVKENAADLLITVTGGEGHQAEWLLPADEYLAEIAANKLSTLPAQQTFNNEALEKLLRKIIAEELAPIKRTLAKAQEQKPGFRDIMGGIGYLLGLAGLVAWLKNRKTDDSQQQ